jgi:hypothetical protein
MTSRPWLVLVGGFLGAGKTTLILAAARELNRRGMRAAAILNDQGNGLVDTHFTRANGVPAAEVTGGCFCCRLSDLITAARELAAISPDVIFAEPVGSCTDISATTIGPILRDHFDEFRLAPYSVLIDPARALELDAIDVDNDLAFLFRKQIEEADIVSWTKSDIRTIPDSAFPHARRLSAKTGEGVAAWLDEILSGGLTAGNTLLDIDYARYARAEAALAWLNLDLTLEARRPLTPAMVIGPLMDEIALELTRSGISIAHLKIVCECASGVLKAALCGNAGEPDLEGALDASPALTHHVRLNLRARGGPALVGEITRGMVERLPGQTQITRFACFQPAAPKPERRITVSS